MDTKNQLSHSEKEHSKAKFGDTDSDMDTRPEDCSDDRDATCTFREEILVAKTRRDTCL